MQLKHIAPILPAFTLLAAWTACQSGKTEPASTAPPAASAGALPAAPFSGGPASASLPATLSVDEAARLLPRLDLGALTPAQRAGVLEAARDTFCFCGCPHTVEGCLKEHPTCRHAPRVGALLADEIAGGRGPGLAVVAAEQYYASFAKNKRIEVETEGALKGDASAPVTIVEYSDFQCPSCAAAHPILQELLAGKYAGKVRLYYRHFPLPQHPRAMVAAQAAEYAREKGKFWELAELMFKNQEQLEDENLGKLARQAGLDPAAMLAAVADGTYSTHVIADRTHGEALGIRGTPTLFINGRPFFLRPSRENIERTLDDELDWIQNGGQWSAD